MITRTIMVTFSEVGFHEWPEAPPETLYLASEHRHRFDFRVEARVQGDDREVEFHCLLQAIKLAMVHAFIRDDAGYKFGMRSCEHIAVDLKARIAADFAISAIEVWEDGECGARVEWSA